MTSNLLFRLSAASLSSLLVLFGLQTSSAAAGFDDDDCPVDECMTVWGSRDRWTQLDLFDHLENEMNEELAEMHDPRNQMGGGGDGGDSASTNPKDRDGDGEIDCWRDLTADPDAPISPFNDPRKKGPHQGLDIKVGDNTEVYSAGDGEVVEVDYTNENGYFIRINLDNGNQIVYLHFRSHSSDNQAGLDVGDRVVAGQLVGLSGNTGDVDGPNDGYHVHVEVVEGYDGDDKADDDYTRLDPVEAYGGSNCQAAEAE